MKPNRNQKATYHPSDLSHPNWLNLRDQIVKKRGRKCERCGRESSEIHVHHKTYIEGRRAWEYRKSQLEILCDECHGDEHGYVNRCGYEGCGAIIADRYQFCVRHFKQVEIDEERKRVRVERQELICEKGKVDSEKEALERKRGDVERRVESAQMEIKQLEGSAKHYASKQKEAKEKYDKQVAELNAVNRQLREMEEQVTNLEQKIRQKVLAETELERQRKIQEGIDESEGIKGEARKKAEEKIKTAENHSKRMIFHAGLGVLLLAFALFFYVLAAIGVKQLSASLKGQDAADSIQSSNRRQDDRFSFRSDVVPPSGGSKSSLEPGSQSKSNVTREPAPTKVPLDEVSGHLECPRKDCAGTMRLENIGGTLRYVCSNSPQCKMKIEYPFKCYRCGAEMVLRDGKNGKFWGCSTFPKCRHTNDYK